MMFSQLIFIAPLAPLRVPSDAPQLRRVFADDPIAEFISQKGEISSARALSMELMP